METENIRNKESKLKKLTKLAKAGILIGAGGVFLHSYGTEQQNQLLTYTALMTMSASLFPILLYTAYGIAHKRI